MYACGGFGAVVCVDRKSHEVVWECDMEELYGGERPSFGWAASPLVVGDKVIVTPLGEEIGLVALDRFTGEEAWVTETVGHSHSTPVLVELHGKPQIVFLSTAVSGTGEDASAPTMLSSFDPEFGELLWRAEVELTRLAIPPPVQIDAEHLFLTGGYRGGSSLVRVAGGGSDETVDVLFHLERGNQLHPPLLHDGHLYGLVNENWNNERARRKEGGLMCLGLDGEEKWRTGDDPFFGRGNVIMAGDHLLVQDGFNGVLRVVKATPAGYTQVPEANVFGIEDDDDHEMWAPMALASGFLIMRSQEEMLCIEL